MPTAPTIHCPSVDCPGSDNPIANLSSERPDPAGELTYLGIGYAPNPNDPGGPPGDPGPNSWTAKGCIADCTSLVSQEDADLCAARQVYLCQNPPGGDPAPTRIRGPAPGVFLSAEATCSSKCPDGLLFSFTLAAGQFVAASQLLADREAVSYACRQARLHRICLSVLSPSECCVNSPYTGTITASGLFVDSDPSNIWELTGGALPNGLTFNGGFKGSSITIDGTPTQSGTFTFSVRVTLTNGDFMDKTETLCVIDQVPNPLGIDDSTFPDATIGTPYNNAIAVTGCATGAISYQVTDGALPAGLTLDEATGIITGTPTGPAQSNQFTVTIQTQAT